MVQLCLCAQKSQNFDWKVMESRFLRWYKPYSELITFTVSLFCFTKLLTGWYKCPSKVSLLGHIRPKGTS